MLVFSSQEEEQEHKKFELVQKFIDENTEPTPQPKTKKTSLDKNIVAAFHLIWKMQQELLSDERTSEVGVSALVPGKKWKLTGAAFARLDVECYFTYYQRKGATPCKSGKRERNESGKIADGEKRRRKRRRRRRRRRRKEEVGCICSAELRKSRTMGRVFFVGENERPLRW